MREPIAGSAPVVLPPHLEQLRRELPPYLRFPAACKVRGLSKMPMRARIKDGRIIAVKDGKNTLVQTLSILLDLASLPTIQPKPLTGHDGKPVVPKTFGHRSKRKASADVRQGALVLSKRDVPSEPSR